MSIPSASISRILRRKRPTLANARLWSRSRDSSPLRRESCSSIGSPLLTRGLGQRKGSLVSSKSFEQTEDEKNEGQFHHETAAGISIGAAVAWLTLSSKLTLNASEEPEQDSKDKKGQNEAVSCTEEASSITVTPKSKEKKKSSRKLQAVSSESSSEEEEDSSNSEEEKKSELAKRERVGFRDRKIIDYENRIRAYSTPDKIFRYFGTYRSSVDNEVYMTPSDFLRSITPGVKQPEGLGLDQFKKFDPATMKMSSIESEDIEESSIFHHLGCSGLISFSDYIFLLTILSTSKRQFEIAFRMFDLNGDGDVDAEEFAQVENIIRQTTSVGSRHRDHAATGSTLKGMNSALANYFFGENLDGKLTIERFLSFQEQLQREILSLEFARKSPSATTGNIAEKDFADLLLTYADYSSKKRSAVLKRVRKKYPNHGDQKGISLEDYIQIFSLLIHIDDVDKALYFYNLAGASIDPKTLQHVAKVCANVDLSDHVVEVIFVVFDEDGDGALSNKEFVSVMKNKLKRGLEKPKDTGLLNFLSAVAKCAKLTPKAAAEAVSEAIH